MTQDNIKSLNSSLASIEQCQLALRKMATTCCMPDRSPNMEAAFEKLKSIVSTIEKINNDEKSPAEVVRYMGEFGSQIGYLYATCCTEEREPLYQDIFKNLNQAHGKIWEVMGINH